MKVLKINSVVMVLIFIAINCTAVYAWDDTETHPDMTRIATKIKAKDEDEAPLVQLYLRDILGFRDDFMAELPYEGKQEKILKILQKGSKEEDAWPYFPLPFTARSRHHFHSPIMNQGLHQDWNSGESALVWARGDSGKNDYSWLAARQSYREAFEAFAETNSEKRKEIFETKMSDMFRSLGQLIHLIQDMGVPAHTRNDFWRGHIFGETPFQNNFERWAAKNKGLVNIFAAEGKIPLFVDLNEMQLDYFWDTDEYEGILSDSFNNGLAEYSSANFLSTGRMFVENTEFPHPRKSDTNYYTIDWTAYEERYAEDGTLDTPLYIYKTVGEEPGKEYRLAAVGFFTKEHNEYFQEVGIGKTLHLDDACHQDYAERLIPKAVGYSAGVLNYFFRGELEISAPVRHLYAIIDGAEDPQEFTEIKANIKNISEYQEAPETMGEGQLWAIAKYKVQQDYDPCFIDIDPSLDYDSSAQFAYSVSGKISVTDSIADELNSETGHEAEFVFNTPIPANISDLYLQVVFQGKLGGKEGTDENNGEIVVGVKDLNEPAHVALFNSTDYIFVCNNGDQTLQDCPGFQKTVDLEEDTCADPCTTCPPTCGCEDIVKCSPQGEEEICPYPLHLEYSLAFHPSGTGAPPDPHIEYVLPPGYHARMIVLADNAAGNLSVSGTYRAFEEEGPNSDTCPWFIENSGEISATLPSTTCQCVEDGFDSDGVPLCFDWDCNPELLEHRGMKTHKFLLDGDSVYGAHSFLLRLENDQGLPASKGDIFNNANWPGLWSEDPWSADMIDN